jgi:hypothetical protein
LRQTLILLGLLAALNARAEPETLGPDGKPVTRSDFPAALASRPITLPEGMGALSFTFGGQVVNDGVSAPTFSLNAGAAYGVARNVQLGVEFAGNGSGLGAYGIYQVGRSVAFRLAGDYSSSTSTSAAGDTSVSRRFALTGGVPLKAKLAGLPLAIGALDSVVAVYFPIATTSTPDPAPAYVRLSLPIYLQLDPTPFLGLEARFIPTFPVTSNAGLTTLAVTLAAYFTTPRFDAGLVGGLTTRSADSGIAQPNIVLGQLVLRGRL